MTNKLYTLITTIIGAVATIASAVIAYVDANPAIIVSIGIGSTAAIDILSQFVIKDEKEETK